jgi:hypothetical protein
MSAAELPPEEQARWQEIAAGNLQAIRESGLFLAIFTDAYTRDPLALMQLGLAVVLDKPVLLLARAGATIPENVRRMAHGIEEFHDLSDLEPATKRLLTRARKERADGRL